VISIIKKNFQDSQVEAHVLDSLIASDKLIAFSRGSAWVVIGKDVVREQYTFYDGQERRRIIYGHDFFMK